MAKKEFLQRDKNARELQKYRDAGVDDKGDGLTSIAVVLETDPRSEASCRERV